MYMPEGSSSQTHVREEKAGVEDAYCQPCSFLFPIPPGGFYPVEYCKQGERNAVSM